MKRFALPALLVAAAFFTFSSTASADHGRGGSGYSYGGGYGSYYGPSYGYGDGCRSGGYGSYYRSNRYYQPRGYGNFGRQHHHHGHNRGFNSGGIRFRTGNFGFGLRF